MGEFGSLRKKKNFFGECILAGILLWVVVSVVAFRFRHPWATETETFVHWIEVLTFERVPYSDMRPRD